MVYRYFKIHDSCFRVKFDEEDIPESCEKFNIDDGDFHECDPALPDVIESHQSVLISEEDLEDYLNHLYSSTEDR